jgi:hypothetical protein
MRSALKALPLAVLGLAAALLVACGDRNGLLSSGQAGSLQDALAAVQSACADGDSGRAAVAAQSFADRVDALPADEVDRALIRDLQDGAATLESLVPSTCTGAVTTTTTPTVTTPTTPTTPTTTTTTTPTTTTQTTTSPTTPTTPTPTEPTTPTTPPDTGGGAPGDEDDDDGGPGNSGGAPGDSGGASPGQLKQALKRLEKESKE